jgi:hypothetical protein
MYNVVMVPYVMVPFCFHSELFKSAAKNLIYIFYISHLVILLIVMYGMSYVSHSLSIESFCLNKLSSHVSRIISM